MSFFGVIRFLDSLTGTVKSLQWNGEAPQICAQPYLQALAEGDIPGHTPWVRIGYSPLVNTTESDIWGLGGVHVFPTIAGKLEVLSSNNTQDLGIIIKGDATGNTVQADVGGSTTTLVDADVDFTAATSVAVAGTVPVTTNRCQVVVRVALPDIVTSPVYPTIARFWSVPVPEIMLDTKYKLEEE